MSHQIDKRDARVTRSPTPLPPLQRLTPRAPGRPRSARKSPHRARDVTCFMKQLAAAPTPAPRHAPRRALLRRARIESFLRLRRKRAAYSIAPALIMEATTYVTLLIACTQWASARWPELHAFAMRDVSGAGFIPSGVPLNIPMAALLLLVALACVLAAPRVRC